MMVYDAIESTLQYNKVYQIKKLVLSQNLSLSLSYTSSCLLVEMLISNVHTAKTRQPEQVLRPS